jgi:hypothetical protein
MIKHKRRRDSLKRVYFGKTKISKSWHRNTMFPYKSHSCLFNCLNNNSMNLRKLYNKSHCWRQGYIFTIRYIK